MIINHVTAASVLKRILVDLIKQNKVILVHIFIIFQSIFN